MENYWTSSKTINGLRHFVLVNEIKEKGIEKVAKSYEAICNYIQSELKW